jgi:hypothetical protein
LTPAEIQRRQQSNANFQRARAQQLREFEQRKRQSQAEYDRLRQQALADIEKAQAGAAAKASGPPLPPFNPLSAPLPEECLRAFFAATRNAKAMDPLLGYLPLDEQKSLQQQQARYDPKQAAASRQQWKQRNPTMSEHSLTFLTNSPYANALDHYQMLANKFIDVLDVKISGNKATLIVSTLSGATSGGERYPYGKATIELIGEGNYWRFSSYNDSGWSYKAVPLSP